MPIVGKGMLLTSMDIDAEHEEDFNRWYDREHLAERVAIEGFVEARRYVADDASPKYLSLYSTRSFDVLDSPDYRAALANQTVWSKTNIARFRNMVRAVAHITLARGRGRGAALGLMRIRPDPSHADPVRDALNTHFDPNEHDGIVAMHLLESDCGLSRSLTDPTATKGASDWFVLIDATTLRPVAPLVSEISQSLLRSTHADVVSSGTYHLMFDLAASDL